LSWPIYIVDWTDGPTPQKCPEIEQEVGPEFVKYTHRSIVTGRRFSEIDDWVHFGRIIPAIVGNRTYRHTPLIVRTDTVENLYNVLKERGIKTLNYPIETLERPVDVTHLWPLDLKGVGDVESRLRTKVSQIVDSMGKEHSDLNVYVGLAGKAAREGRRGTNSAYIEALLQTKILIVTQRDGWVSYLFFGSSNVCKAQPSNYFFISKIQEDHYRLFEALVNGPMVLADKMLSLPKGLENGKSLVEFASEDDLRAKILYYSKHHEERIAIAREGRRIAMDRHRSWHRMEEVIFGDILTRCHDKSPEDCPFLVHADGSDGDAVKAAVAQRPKSKPGE